MLADHRLRPRPDWRGRDRVRQDAGLLPARHDPHAASVGQPPAERAVWPQHAGAGADKGAGHAEPGGNKDIRTTGCAPKNLSYSYVCSSFWGDSPH